LEADWQKLLSAGLAAVVFDRFRILVNTLYHRPGRELPHSVRQGIAGIASANKKAARFGGLLHFDVRVVS
jgi:hypothetical protein